MHALTVIIITLYVNSSRVNNTFFYHAYYELNISIEKLYKVIVDILC